jgi:hypothetical protein
MKHVEMIIDYIVDGDDFQYCDNKGRLIRCKDCKNWRDWGNGTGECRRSETLGFWFGANADDYCSFAERKEQ